MCVVRIVVLSPLTDLEHKSANGTAYFQSLLGGKTCFRQQVLGRFPAPHFPGDPASLSFPGSRRHDLLYDWVNMVKHHASIIKRTKRYRKAKVNAQ